MSKENMNNTSVLNSSRVSVKQSEFVCPDYRVKGNELASLVNDAMAFDMKVADMTKKKDEAAARMDFVEAEGWLQALKALKKAVTEHHDAALSGEYAAQKEGIDAAYKATLRDLDKEWTEKDAKVNENNVQARAALLKKQDEEREAFEAEHKRVLESIAASKPVGNLLDLEARIKKLASLESYQEAAKAKAEFDTERAAQIKGATEKAWVVFHNGLQKLNQRHHEQLEKHDKAAETMIWYHEKEKEKAYAQAEHFHARDLKALVDSFNIKSRRVTTPKVQHVATAPASPGPFSPNTSKQNGERSLSLSSKKPTNIPTPKRTASTPKTPGKGKN